MSTTQYWNYLDKAGNPCTAGPFKSDEDAKFHAWADAGNAMSQEDYEWFGCEIGPTGYYFFECDQAGNPLK